MADGYLVTLGDGSLDEGDAIAATLSTFTIDSTIGSGSWTWSGVWDGNGQTYNNITDTGIYYLGTDGNTYFIPDTWFTTSGSATATEVPDLVVDGTAGNDTITTGYTDPDGIVVGTGDNTIAAGDGTDTITTEGGSDTIFGERGADSIASGSGNDTIFGGADGDTINSNADADLVFGGDGADSILAGQGADTIYGGSGADTIDGEGNTDTIYGGGGDDSITDTGGSLSDDTIFGGAGNDDIAAGAREDLVYGGSGSDTIRGEAGTDTLEGGTENDIIFGGDDGDLIYGDDIATATPSSANLSWVAEGAGGTDLDGSFVQNTGGMSVEVEITNTGTATGMAVSGTTQFVDTGEPFATDSSLSLTGGAGPTSTVILNFEAEPDTGLSDEVANVTFRINDIDMSGWQDIITVNGYDADGNLVSPTITIQDPTGTNPDTVSGNTITAGNQGDSASDASGSALISFGSAVQSVEIIYSNGGTSGQALWITDVHFDTQAANTDAGNDTLHGDAGDDTVFGNGGDDTLYGGSGNDSLVGGTGADVIEGDTDPLNSGNDTVSGGAGNDSLDGSAGNDSVYGGGDSDTVSGGDGDDLLDGGTEADTIYGGGGDDLISLSASFGNDTIEGGETGETNGDILDASGLSSDIVLDLSAVDPADGESGTLTTAGDTATFAEIETVVLGSGNDSVTGSTGVDQVTTGAGQDTVNLGAGDDQLDLGDGSGGSDGAADSIVLQNGFGNDTISNFDTPTANGDGTFTGVDTFEVSALLHNGVPVYAADVVVTADGSGNALLTMPGGETITLLGITQATADSIPWLTAVGFAPLDGTVEGSSGDDTIDGSYQGDPEGDMVDAGDAILAGDTGDDDLIYGYGGNDSITAGAGADEVYGGADADTIDGGAGNDSIYAGTGDDTILADDAGGTDVVAGGEDVGGGDVDTLELDSNTTTQGVTVTSSGSEEGSWSFDGSSAGGTFTEIEALDTTEFDDTINLASETSGMTVTSNAGNDSITGGSGDDSVLAGTGQDTVSGGLGDDTIFGQADADSIEGGEGADALFGGAEDDVITFSEGDTVSGGSGDDTIILANYGETGNGTITVNGDGGDETSGDTLQLGTLANLTNAVRDTFVDDGTGSYSGTITLDDGTILNFSEIENIICFTPGARIATPLGARPVEELKIGDRVVTRDHGIQPIRWIGSRTVQATGRFAPVRIRPGVVCGLQNEILVSPQHRMLFQDYRAELLFGESEVLVAAKHLIDGVDVTQDEGGLVTYIHLMFDEHEVIFAEGAATESFHPGKNALDALAEPCREELFALFPELRSVQGGFGETARRCLKRHEALMLIS